MSLIFYVNYNYIILNLEISVEVYTSLGQVGSKSSTDFEKHLSMYLSVCVYVLITLTLRRVCTKKVIFKRCKDSLYTYLVLIEWFRRVPLGPGSCSLGTRDSHKVFHRPQLSTSTSEFLVDVVSLTTSLNVYTRILVDTVVVALELSLRLTVRSYI